MMGYCAVSRVGMSSGLARFRKSSMEHFAVVGSIFLKGTVGVRAVYLTASTFFGK